MLWSVGRTFRTFWTFCWSWQGWQHWCAECMSAYAISTDFVISVCGLTVISHLLLFTKKKRIFCYSCFVQRAQVFDLCLETASYVPVLPVLLVYPTHPASAPLIAPCLTIWKHVPDTFSAMERIFFTFFVKLVYVLDQSVSSAAGVTHSQTFCIFAQVIWWNHPSPGGFPRQNQVHLSLCGHYLRTHAVASVNIQREHEQTHATKRYTGALWYRTCKQRPHRSGEGIFSWWKQSSHTQRLAVVFHSHIPRWGAGVHFCPKATASKFCTSEQTKQENGDQKTGRDRNRCALPPCRGRQERGSISDAKRLSLQVDGQVSCHPRTYPSQGWSGSWGVNTTATSTHTHTHTHTHTTLGNCMKRASQQRRWRVENPQKTQYTRLLSKTSAARHLPRLLKLLGDLLSTNCPPLLQWSMGTLFSWFQGAIYLWNGHK